ncbi:MAG: thioredoxin [Gemmatimonadota bacterium]
MTPDHVGVPVTLRCPFCLTLNQVDLEKAEARPRCGKCEKPMLLDRPMRVSEEDFERTVLEAGGPVIVDFYADWCQPCKLMAPLLDDLAREHVGRVLFTKVDSDQAQGLATRMGIRGIPTLVAFRDGAEIGRTVGFDPSAVKALVGKVA